MRDDKKSKLSWSKNLIKKWFSVKSKARHYHAGEDDMRGSGERRHIYSEMDSFAVKKSRTERLIRTNSARAPSTRTEQIENYRIFVSTWNVGGRSPAGHLNLDAWLHTAPPADVYVLGFQEIVPLNAGNVLGAEDSGPARKWIALIRKTLEGLPGGSGRPTPTSAGRWATSRRSFQAHRRSTRMDDEVPARLERRFSILLSCKQADGRNLPHYLGQKWNKRKCEEFEGLLRGPGLNGLPWKQRFDINKHVTSPDNILLRLQPSDVRREGRR